MLVTIKLKYLVASTQNARIMIVMARLILNAQAVLINFSHYVSVCKRQMNIACGAMEDARIFPVRSKKSIVLGQRLPTLTRMFA
jgi:hypothetical protein